LRLKQANNFLMVSGIGTDENEQIFEAIKISSHPSITTTTTMTTTTITTTTTMTTMTTTTTPMKSKAVRFFDGIKSIPVEDETIQKSVPQFAMDEVMKEFADFSSKFNLTLPTENLDRKETNVDNNEEEEDSNEEEEGKEEMLTDEFS